MLTLIKLQELPQPGEQTGVNTKITINSGKDENGIDFQHLNWGVELDAMDSTGAKFQLTKTYNIAIPRGISAFRNDYLAWSGHKLTDYELNKFNAEALMSGKPVKLVIRLRKEGKKTIAVIDRFLRSVVPQVNS